MALVKIAKDKPFSGVCEASADTNTVKVECVVKRDKDAVERVVMHWTFDYANVSAAEMLNLATRRLVVDEQNKLRQAKDFEASCSAADGRTIRVRDVLDAERQSADPMTRAERALGQLTKEQIAELLAKVAPKGKAK